RGWPGSGHAPPRGGGARPRLLSGGWGSRAFFFKSPSPPPPPPATSATAATAATVLDLSAFSSASLSATADPTSATAATADPRKSGFVAAVADVALLSGDGGGGTR